MRLKFAEFEGDLYEILDTTGDEFLISVPGISPFWVSKEEIESFEFSKPFDNTDPYEELIENHLDADLTKTASWSDIQDKAKRLRRGGKVTVITFRDTYIKAQVQGDHDLYNVEVVKDPMTGAKIESWSCTCGWGEWAFKREHTYIGRMCSHALAVYWEMASLEFYQGYEKNTMKTAALDDSGREAEISESQIWDELDAYIQSTEDYTLEDLLEDEDDSLKVLKMFIRAYGDRLPHYLLSPVRLYRELKAVVDYQNSLQPSTQKTSGRYFTPMEQFALEEEEGMARQLPNLNLSRIYG